MSPDKLAEVRGWLAKALKGFLTFHDRPFRKTHDLDELASECERLDDGLVSILGGARDLTPFAWRFRYPGDDEPPASADIDEALGTARRVFRAIVERLPPEAQ